MSRDISIVINVKNGVHTIGKTLSSLHKFNDIVVFDNFSTDGTVQVARAYSNVNLIQHEFCGMGKLRNLASTYARYDWVFSIDCDEVLHPDLADEILSMDFAPNSIYLVERRNYYANKLVASSSWENDWVKRLYNRRESCFNENEVHESLQMGAHISCIKLKSSFIYHFPYSSASGLIDKMQFYSTLYANQNYMKKVPQLWAIPFRAFFMFIKCYILKRGFLDGYTGFVISAYNAIGVFSKYIKLYELYVNQRLGLALRLGSIEKLAEVVADINQLVLLPEEVYVLAKPQLLLENENAVTKAFDNLCVPYKTLHVSEEESYNFKAHVHEQLDYLIVVSQVTLLADKKLLNRYKKKGFRNTQVDGIQLINLR